MAELSMRSRLFKLSGDTIGADSTNASASGYAGPGVETTLTDKVVYTLFCNLRKK